MARGCSRYCHCHYILGRVEAKRLSHCQIRGLAGCSLVVVVVVVVVAVVVAVASVAVAAAVVAVVAVVAAS